MGTILQRFTDLPCVWLLIAAAVVVENGCLGGLPVLLLAAALLWLMLRRGIEAPRHLDWLIAAACVLGFVRAPGAHLSAPFPRIGIGLLTTAVGMVGVLAWNKPRLAGGRALACCLVLSTLAGVLVIEESPRPRIDVFGLEQGGAEALLAGKNPYSQSYANPYSPDETQRFFGDRRTELKQYPYPPLSLAWCTLGYAVGGDVRWSLLVAELLPPLLLFGLARRCGHPPRVALGLSVLQLVHPRGALVLEQAWTESVIGSALLLLLLVLVGRARGWLGGVVLGLFLASKQYSVVLVPLLLLRRVAPRSYWGPAVAVLAAVTVPFLVWGFSDFLDDVVLFQLRQPARDDAMSLPGLIQWATGVRLPGFIALAAATFALAFWWRKIKDATLLPLAAACVYGVFFLTAKQSFCNYYYFLGIVVLAAAAATPAHFALAAPEEAAT
ncbi:MAG: hypothetical protein ACLP1X_19040 [Polyangiaceae bacterium]